MVSLGDIADRSTDGLDRDEWRIDDSLCMAVDFASIPLPTYRGITCRRLMFSWHHQTKPELKAEGPSMCAIDLEPFGTPVNLTITHSIGHKPSKLIEVVSGGWPQVISLLETGSVAMQSY